MTESRKVRKVIWQRKFNNALHEIVINCAHKCYFGYLLKTVNKNNWVVRTPVGKSKFEKNTIDIVIRWKSTRWLFNYHQVSLFFFIRMVYTKPWNPFIATRTFLLLIKWHNHRCKLNTSCSLSVKKTIIKTELFFTSCHNTRISIFKILKEQVCFVPSPVFLK